MVMVADTMRCRCGSHAQRQVKDISWAESGKTLPYVTSQYGVVIIMVATRKLSRPVSSLMFHFLLMICEAAIYPLMFNIKSSFKKANELKKRQRCRFLCSDPHLTQEQQ